MAYETDLRVFLSCDGGNCGDAARLHWEEPVGTRIVAREIRRAGWKYDDKTGATLCPYHAAASPSPSDDVSHST